MGVVLRCLSHGQSIQSPCICLFLLCLAPLFAKFFEFVWTALGAMLLHRDMGVEVVEGTVGLCAVWPVALVETFDLIVASARTFFDCVSGQ